MPVFHVYVMTNEARQLFIGATSNLAQRVYEHKNGLVSAYCTRHGIARLVYFEEARSPQAAVEREQQIKSWLRKRKVELIESINPTWHDLAQGWMDAGSKPDVPEPAP
ncbi:MAG: GIY-YIG nuclease family protein [Candidatus Tectomicrobia bacterium]|uniref:GIY-YIG nuclease family protein n=1 Tax=Tectimicrobiota bacterium TaxID=2528274 RepID=A0A932I032_UNCTE|nr:GIY-YIG nuclease family protein [Candidatus Tectomicrobia bacterium]